MKKNNQAASAIPTETKVDNPIAKAEEKTTGHDAKESLESKVEDNASAPGDEKAIVDTENKNDGPVVDANINTTVATTPAKVEENDLKKDQTISTSSLNVVATTPSNSDNTELHPGLPRVKISYPEDYEGVRYFIDGETYPVSKEVADQLVDLKIATIVE